MPIKLSKSQVLVNRDTKKKSISHDYVKTKSKEELIELYNKSGQLPKRKQKIKNELVRRGGVEFVCPTANVEGSI